VPPRWKIAGAKSALLRPRGVAINPKHKEVYVADMNQNAVLTYYFPEDLLRSRTMLRRFAVVCGAVGLSSCCSARSARPGRSRPRSFRS